jgi:hypothetical protein
MIATDTDETIPFTPQWHEGKKNAPAFELRAGGVIERGRMEAELAGKHRAAKVWGYELRQATNDGVAELLKGDPQLDEILALLSAELEYEVAKAQAETKNETPPVDPLSAHHRRMLEGIRKVLAEHWPAYQDLLSQIERRREIAPIVALQRFCTGFKNCVGDNGKPSVFATDRHGLMTDASLRSLSSLELLAAGNRAFALQYGHGEEKNSSLPPASDDGQLTSNSDDTSTEAGKSPAIAGPKTPASRSRRGSGQS